MKEMNLLSHFTNSEFVLCKELAEYYKVSERTIRNYIRDFNNARFQTGAHISMSKGKGYQLIIEDTQRFDQYKRWHNMDAYYGSNKLRVPEIVRILLQKEAYCSIQSIADVLNVSRDSIERDLKYVEEFLTPFHLKLIKKPHYGIKLEGNELDLRRAFQVCVTQSSDYLSDTNDYFDFLSQININGWNDKIKEILLECKIVLPPKAFESFVEHLSVLIYRVYQRNYIESLDVVHDDIPAIYVDSSQKIMNEISNSLRVKIPFEEVLYLSSQLYGKASVEFIDEEEKKKLIEQISKVLLDLDCIYLTDFSQDSILKNTLLMHMYPLINRLTHKVNLKNPLVNYVSGRYANVYSVSIKFLELWGIQKESLSRDEIGFLTFHFAGYLNRKRQEQIDSITNILIYSDLGRGNLTINRLMIEAAFPKSKISVEFDYDISHKDKYQPSLVLCTSNFEECNFECSVLEIPEILSDYDVLRIKDYAILTQSRNINSLRKTSLGILFSEEWIHFEEVPIDYESLVKKYALDNELKGYSEIGYSSSVMERESFSSTISSKGIAGPHSIVPMAKINCVRIIIPRFNLMHNDKKIQFIFLINLSQGNLLIHREIIKMMHRISMDNGLIERIVNSNNQSSVLSLIDQIAH